MSLPEFSLTGPVGATTVTGYGDSPEAALDSWCQLNDSTVKSGHGTAPRLCSGSATSEAPQPNASDTPGRKA